MDLTQRRSLDEQCQKSEDGKHEPDTETLHLYMERDKSGVYLDVNCKHCGRSGCIGKFDVSDVNW